MRKGALRDIDKQLLIDRIKQYYDPNVTWETLIQENHPLTHDAARFPARKTRERILEIDSFSITRLAKYTLRPFETLWCYYSHIRPLWNEPRPSYKKQIWNGNKFIVTRLSAPRDPEGPPFYLCNGFVDYNFFPPASAFPLRLAPVSKGNVKDTVLQKDFWDGHAPTANLSPAAREYLAGLKIKDPDADAETAGLIWMHALAVGYSPAYLAENTDGIRRDWPRVPLPASKKNLEQSAALGKQVAALLDTETEIAGITAGKIEAIFKTLGVLKKVGGGALNPDAGDLAVTAGWGHAGKAGVTMPGRGRIVERPYTKEETEAIARAAKSRGLTKKAVMELLGPDTRDIYLNDRAYWCYVPANVWKYYIGGYQVIKKWLSYREEALLGRSLKSEEAREVAAMVRRLAAITLLQPALDKNYRRAAAKAYAWPKE